MLTLLRNALHVLLFDESAAKRWLYGLGGFLAVLATSMLTSGLDAILAMTLREFLHHAIIAAVGLAAGMLPAPKAKLPPSTPLQAAQIGASRGLAALPVLAGLVALIAVGLGLHELASPLLWLGALLAILVVAHRSRAGAAVILLLALAVPAKAQELLPPPPPSIPFGGCSRAGNFCAAPAVSLSVAAYGFRTHQFSTGLTPGLGYEVRAFADKWYSIGFELRASIQTGADNRALFSLPVSFAKFIRIGPSYQLINGSGEFGLVFGLGVDSGTIASGTSSAAKTGP